MTDETTNIVQHSGSGIRTELRNLETGIRNGWDIPQATLETVPQRMLEFIERGSRREATAAARVLVAMARHNAELGPSKNLHLHQHQSAPPQATGNLSLEERKQRCRERIATLDRLGRLD